MPDSEFFPGFQQFVFPIVFSRFSRNCTLLFTVLNHWLRAVARI